uniref:Head tail connector n=1 Tax=Siphoviridae sp. cthL03 TaxID=2825615 RepID=A0A8S5PHD6_9CAUD|nr:head-tail connector protein [uncultured Lachnoclostridium sp.]DAE05596.1 MAG TPA: head tail connector [Siphoviridae sp. cthL03]
MKVSEVQVNDIIRYTKEDPENLTPQEIQDISNYLVAAKSFIKSYTGLDDEKIDTHEDITIALYVLCQDMYDNRSMYVEKSNVNRVVETILGMHCINLL